MRALIDVSFRNGLAIVISRDANRSYSRSASRSWEAVESFPTASVAARADRTVRARAPAPRARIAFAAAELRAPTRSAAHVSGKQIEQVA